MKRVLSVVLSFLMALGLYSGPFSMALGEPIDVVEEAAASDALAEEPIGMEETFADDNDTALHDEEPLSVADVVETPEAPENLSAEEGDSPDFEVTEAPDTPMSDDEGAQEASTDNATDESAQSEEGVSLLSQYEEPSYPLTGLAQDSASTVTGLKMPAYDLPLKVKSAISREENKDVFITEDNVLYMNFSFDGGEKVGASHLWSMPNVVEVSTGRRETGVITISGELFVWVHPLNDSGDLYFPNEAPKQQVMPGTTFTHYATSNRQSFAIDSDGNLWAWGENEYGELGNGDTQEVDVSNPVQVLPGVTFTDIAAYSGNGVSDEHCALSSDGTVYAWGPGYEPSKTSGSQVYYPTVVPIPAAVVDVEVGISHYGALDSAGELWMWGVGGNGQLGVLQGENDEKPGEPYSLLEIPAVALTHVKQFSLGSYFSAAVTTDGQAYGWGYNYLQGCVFSSSADNMYVPTMTMTGIVGVGCGEGKTVAVKENGSLWCWGDELWYDENPPHLLVGYDDSAVHVSGEVETTLLTTLDKDYKHEVAHSFQWDDDWMLEDSTQYNPKLSIASMVLAWAAYDDTPANNYRYITEALEALGMGDVQTFSYTNRIESEDSGYKQSIDRVAYSFSHRKTLDGEGNAVDLVFVVVRGTPENIEWNSNANVADGTNEGTNPMFHEGFKAAEQEILNQLAVYFQTHDIDDATARILITGHSRGAAVANLLAADLQNQTATEYTQDVTKDQVYAYTFATPAGAMDAEAHSDAYANIFNIVNPEDFVPRVPLKAWGFERYGTTYYLPSKSTESAKFYSHIGTMQNRYWELCGQGYKPFESGTGATNGMVREAETIASTVSEYNTKPTPDGLVSLMASVTEKDIRWQTFREFFGNLTTYLAVDGAAKWDAILQDVVGSWMYGPYGRILDFFLAHTVTDRIAHAHTKETYLGWLEVLDESGVPLMRYGERSDTGKLTTYCPVGLTVYDGDGHYVGQIRSDGSIYVDGNSPVALMYDETTDAKTVWLPTWGGYTVKIVPYDDGVMDVTWSECDVEGNEIETACFNDVALEYYQDYEFSVDAIEEGQSVVEAAILTDSVAEVVEPTYVIDPSNEVSQVQISVTSEGNGTVMGPGRAVVGEHVCVNAMPDEGYAFDGWYESGVAVGAADENYTFRAEGDRNLVARFVLIEAEDIDMLTTMELSVGERAFLWVDVYPWQASGFPVAYSSSDEAVATVDEDGYVTAISGGTATITVRVPRVLGGTDYIEETCLVTVAAGIENCSVTLEETSATYTGKALKPSVTVNLGDTTLVAGTDYTVSYKNNVKAGTATVVVTGTGSYCGEATVTFKINRASLSKATVTVKAQTYTGKALKPAPTVKVGGRTLKSGTDYTLAYKNNTKVGTATVTVKGKGNYSGSKSATFKITRPSVAKATVSKVANQKYDGVAKRPSPTVKVGGKTLKKGTDYTLTYKNNVKAGTATVTIKGKGSYTGTKSVTFKIVAMAGTWKGSGSKWWYEWKDGKYPKSVFLDISGKTYYFDASGYCVYGWKQINKKYYYFESSGAMAKSKWVGNYYLKADGTMATSEWVDGGKYWVGADGAWVKGKTR